MNRRDFIALIGGATTAPVLSPLAARAQPSGPTKHLGVLTALTQDDPAGRARLAAFQQALGERGWIEGRNLRQAALLVPAHVGPPTVHSPHLFGGR